MQTFIVSSDNVFRYNQDTVVVGLHLDDSLEQVSAKLERYFPTVEQIKDGYRLETMLMLPVAADFSHQTALSLLPLSSLSFNALKGKERYVLIEKRDPETKRVVFKDDDTFFEDDPKMPDIQKHLLGVLIDNFEFYKTRYQALQGKIA